MTAASGFRLTYSQGEIELPPGEHFIGRASECFIRLDQPMVSRRHARLVVGDDVYFEDHGLRSAAERLGRRIALGLMGTGLLGSGTALLLAGHKGLGEVFFVAAGVLALGAWGRLPDFRRRR